MEYRKGQILIWELSLKHMKKKAEAPIRLLFSHIKVNQRLCQAMENHIKTSITVPICAD